MTQVPSTWIEVEIGCLCNLINGRAFQKTEWSESGIPIIRIQNLNNKNASFNYFSGDLDPKHKVSPGTLLFAWSGTPGTSFGAHEWSGTEGALNQHIFKIQFDENLVNKKFFRLSINQELSNLIDNAQGAVGLRHITKSTFTETKIAFPPLNEQIRIANKLDSLLTKVEAVQARLEKIPTLLKRFRQAVLAAATTGELSGNSKWRMVTLGDVAKGFNYGSSTKSQAEGKVPVLRMGNLQGGKLDWTDLVYTSDQAEIEKYLLEPGDVLFNRTNSPELVGKTSIYRGERKCIYAGYLIRIKGSEQIDSEYLNIQLNSPHAKDYCWQVKTDGVSQSNINAKKIQAYEFEMPPIAEQKNIVRRVDSLMGKADIIELQYLKAKKRIDKLTQSLLAKAFRGELVPQDPNDEPASELLKKIMTSSKSYDISNQKRIRKPKEQLETVSIMKIADAPEKYLFDLLTKMGGEVNAKELWKESEFDIDDFYAKLKQEMQEGLITDDSSSADPSLRKLKIPSNKANSK